MFEPQVNNLCFRLEVTWTYVEAEGPINPQTASVPCAPRQPECQAENAFGSQSVGSKVGIGMT